jgi:hypothetical protein
VAFFVRACFVDLLRWQRENNPRHKREIVLIPKLSFALRPFAVISG